MISQYKWIKHNGISFIKVVVQPEIRSGYLQNTVRSIAAIACCTHMLVGQYI